MLKHEVMATDEWHDNGPQNVIALSVWIQIAIEKMQLCFLSIAYACPYHNPTATKGRTVQNVVWVSKPLTHTTPYMLSDICPGRVKSEFVCEERAFPAC
jgi:hypothetical protein